MGASDAMARESEVVKDYEESLSELRQNSKPQINMLTMLAEENAEFAPAVARVIEEHIFRVERAQKLPGLYLLDSIVKNYKKDEAYRNAFARRLVHIFKHVFENVDEKARSALWRLRNTWNPIFPHSRLYGIDIKIHDIDANWPVASIAIENSSSSTTASSSSAADAADSPKIHVNPAFIGSSKSRRVVIPSNGTDHAPTKSERKAGGGSREASKEPSDPPRAKEAPREAASSREASRSPREAEPPPQPPPSSLPSRDPRSRDPRVKRQPMRDESGPGAAKMRRHGRSPPPNPGMPPASSIQPTSQPGTHAFVSAPSQPQPPQPQPPPMAPTPAPIPVPIPAPIPAPIPPRPLAPVQTWPSTTNGHGRGLLPAPDAVPPSHPVQAAVTAPPSAPSAPAQPIQANNRIFVDGRAYEVQYIGETPIIERSGLPHRIYFAGPPRDVVIDGTPYLLAFGQEISVNIDGQQHRIRFGAPARELYMGSFSFRGQFGGPPIRAKINGKFHLIALCGPPPEVKIEPEPAHELQRHLNHRQQPQQRFIHDLPSQPQPQPQPGLGQGPVQTSAPPDVSALLSRLKQSGVLDSIITPTAGPSSATSLERENTPPIRCQFGFTEDEEVERRPAPPSNLRDFSIRILRSRYASVIETLYDERGQRCSHCGLRFTGMARGEEDSRFRAHMDAHFRANNAGAESGRGESRAWFLSSAEWILHSEMEEEAREAREAADSAQASPARPSVILREGMEAKCGVCKEDLEKEWEDEEEHWILLDAEEADGVVFHAACRNDLSRQGSFLGSGPDVPGGEVLPGLSSLKVEVKQEPEPPTPNSAANPICLDCDPVIEPTASSIKAEPEESSAPV